MVFATWKDAMQMALWHSGEYKQRVFVYRDWDGLWVAIVTQRKARKGKK